MPFPSRGARDFLLYQIVWGACVGGAATGLPPAGVVVGAIFVAAQLAFARSRVGLLRLVLTAVLLGVTVEVLLVASGALMYGRTLLPAPLPPLWIIALWASFATTLPTAFRWLENRPGLGALLGAIGGPVSYLAGERLGALELGPGRPVAVASIAVLWAIAVPLLSFSASRVARLEATAAPSPITPHVRRRAERS